MVYIEREKRLSRVKSKLCCRKIPENSHKLNKLLHERKKYVTPELTRTPAGTKKIEAERLMNTVQRLETKQEEADVKRKDLVKQWAELTKNEKKLRKAFIKFNEFAKFNQEKLEREGFKIKHIREQIKAREFAIGNIKLFITDYKIVNNQMRNEIEKHIIYEKFLEKYAEYIKVRHIREVLNRYADLVEAREKLFTASTESYGKILQYSKRYDKIVQTWVDETLRLSEQLTLQTKRFDDAHQNALHWQGIVLNVQLHAEKAWMDTNLTKDALNHVASLLLLRLKAKTSPEIFRKNKAVQHILASPDGKFLYINKVLSDLTRVNKELSGIFDKEENKDSLPDEQDNKTRSWRGYFDILSEVSYFDTESTIRKVVATETPASTFRKVEEKKEEFPNLSPCTAKLLEKLASQPSEEKWYKKRKDKYDSIEKGSSTSSETVSESIASEDRRGRAMTLWGVIKSSRKHLVHKDISSGASTTSKTTYVLESLGASLQPRRSTVPWSRKSGFVPWKYACVALSTDPTSKLLEEKESKLQSRIIERNFDRYEQNYNNPTIDPPSSIIKINKRTGKLELPKLHFSRKPLKPGESSPLWNKPRTTKFDLTLPKISPDEDRKSRRKTKASNSGSSRRSSKASRASQRSKESKKDEQTMAEVKKFMERPTVINTFALDNFF